MSRREPQVTKIAWRAEQTLPIEQVATECMRRGGWDERAWGRIVWHGGLHVDRERLLELPESVAAGSAVVAYGFVTEPPVVHVGRDAVLYDAGGVVVVDKPTGLAVQGTRATSRLSLETQLRELLDCPFLTPVHRLDRDTSGLNVFARDPASAAWLCRQFFARSVEKIYLARVRPPPSEARWSVHGEMVQVEHPRHARYALVAEPRPGSRPSESDFARLSDDGLVECRPRTGRTHQLRVHLAASGCPIVGDTLYGDAEDPAARLMLHAAELEIDLPSGERRRFAATCPIG